MEFSATETKVRPIYYQNIPKSNNVELFRINVALKPIIINRIQQLINVAEK